MPNPTPYPQLNFLITKIDKSEKGVDTSRLYYRGKAFWLYMSTTILSALVTVLLALTFKDAEIEVWLKRISIVLTALITILSGYNAFFNHKDVWVANNLARNKLKQLKFDIDFRVENPLPISSQEIDDFKDRYQLILDELNASWAKSRA